MVTKETLDKAQELLARISGDDEWVDEVFPILHDITTTLKDAEASKKDARAPLNKQLAEVSKEYDRTIKALTPIDTALRTAIKENYKGESQVYPGFGELIISHPWTYQVVDLSIVPMEYLTINNAAVMADIKDGMRDIPGLTIERSTQVTIRNEKEEE